MCVILILESPPRPCGMERGSFVCGYKCLSELDLFLKLLLLDSHEHVVSVHGKRTSLRPVFLPEATGVTQ